MMIWQWLKIGAVGGVCWWIQAKRGGCLFLVLVLLNPCSLTLSMVFDGYVVEMVSELKILGVILDSKLAFEKQVRAIAASTRGGSVFWGKQWVFFKMSLLLPIIFQHSYSLCWSTALQFVCPLPNSIKIRKNN